MADDVFDAAQFDVCRAISSSGDPAILDDFQSADDVHRTADGGLAWVAVDPAPPGLALHPWLVTTEALVEDHSIQVTFETPNDQITGAELQASSKLLFGLDRIRQALVPAIAEDLQSSGAIFDLTHDLFDQLPTAYLSQLFPSCIDAAAMTAEAMVNALVVCEAKVVLPGHGLAVGYRLLVDTPSDEDREAETALPFGDRFDVTGPIVVVTTTAGRITGLRTDT